MPPLQALVALHGLWILIILPATLSAARKWPLSWLRLVGVVLTTVGLLVLAILGGRELLHWYPAADPARQRFIVQRIVYVLATTTDLPVLQVITAGVTLRLAARRRTRRVLWAEVGPRPAEGQFTEVATRSG